MKQKITSAVLGSTGYTGLELINILSRHPNVTINFLGSDTFSGEEIKKFDDRITNKFLPKLELVKNIDLSNINGIPACLNLHDIDIIVRIRTLKNIN